MWQRRVFWTSWLLQVWNPCQTLVCVNLATVARYRLSTDAFFVLFALCCSLVKMVYAIAAKSGQRPMWNQLEHAIRRNFGGLVEGEPVEIFKRRFQIADVSIKRNPDQRKVLLWKTLSRGIKLSWNRRCWPWDASVTSQETYFSIEKEIHIQSVTLAYV